MKNIFIFCHPKLVIRHPKKSISLLIQGINIPIGIQNMALGTFRQLGRNVQAPPQPAGLPQW